MQPKRKKALRIVLILGVLFVSALALSWRPLIDRVLREMLVDQLAHRLSADVKIGSLDITFFPPSIVAENMTVERTTGPLRYVGVSRASIEPGTGPIFLGKVVLKRIEILNPTIRLDLTDETPKKEKKERKFRIPKWQDALRVEIGELSVRNSNLSLQLPGDLSIHVRGGSSDLSAKQGDAQWKWQGSSEIRRGDKSLQLDQVDIAARLKGETVELEQFDLRGIGASVSLKGKAYPSASLLLEMRGELAPVEKALLELGALKKPLQLSGRVGAEGRVQGNWDDLAWSGEFRGDALEFRRRKVSRLAFSFRVKRRVIEAVSGEVDMGGSVATFSVGSLGPGRPGSFEIAAEGIPYSVIQTFIDPEQKARLGGDVTLRASGNVGFKPWVFGGSYAVTSPEVRLELEPDMRVYLPMVYRNIDVTGNATWAEEKGFSLEEGIVKADGVDGTYHFNFRRGPEATGVWNATVTDIGAVFDRRFPLRGTGRVGGGLTFKDHHYRAVLELQVDDLKQNAHGPYRFSGDIAFENNFVRLQKFHLWNEAEDLTLEATIPHEVHDDLLLQGRLSQVDFGLVGDLFARRYPFLSGVQGYGDGEIEMRGKKSALDGFIRASSKSIQWRDFEASRLESSLDFEKGNLIIQKATAEADALKLSASGVVGRGELQNLEIRFDRFPLSAFSLPPIATRLASEANGVVTLNGPTSDPQIKGSLRFGRIEEGKLVAAGSGGAEGTLSQLSWSLSLDEDRVAAQGKIDARTGANFQGEGRLEKFSLRAFLPTVDPESIMTAQWQLAGDLREYSTLHGGAQIESLLLKRGRWDLSLAQPASISLNAGVFQLDPTELQGASTKLRVFGANRLGGKLDITLEGPLDLGVLSLLSEKISLAEGRADLSIRLQGTVQAPLVHGSVSVSDGRLQIQGFLNPIESIAVAAVLDQKRITVQKATAKVGDGDVSASGDVILSTSLDQSMFDLNGEIRKVRLHFPRVLPSEVSGTLSLSGPIRRPLLRGDILVHEATYRENWNWQSKILSFGRVAKAAQTSRPENERILFDLALHSEGDRIFLRNEVATATLRADIRLTGSDRSLGALGRVELVEGEVTFLETKFEVTSGLMTFDDPRAIHPSFEISAKTRVQTTDIFLELRTERGEVVAYLTSQPQKDETNIISLLTLGVDQDELATSKSGADSAGTAAIGGVLSSAVTGNLETNLRRAKIIDTFQFVPYFSTDTETTGIKMIIGKQLFPKFRLTYATDLFSQSGGENTMKLEQGISRHMSVQGSVRDNTADDNEDIDVGLDLEFRFEF